MAATATAPPATATAAPVSQARPPVGQAAILPARMALPPVVKEQFGIDHAAWKSLVEAVFPNATSIDSVVLALSYCKARKLDPFKRVVHIVPIWSKEKGGYVDTIWPGIGELRTTAFRTGEYAGRGETEFGPDITEKVGSLELTYPEWARVSVFRMVRGVRVEFSGPRVYWLETYATVKRNDDTPNDMWANRPRGQIDKCAEAAALRSAFPEEIGSDYIPGEVQHQVSGKAVDAISVKPANSLGSLTKQLQQQSPAPVPAPEAPQYVTPTGEDPADATEPETEPERQPEAEQVEPNDYASTIASQLQRAVEQGDLATVRRIEDEHFSPESVWEPASEEECESVRTAVNAAKAALANPSARAKGKQQKSAFPTHENEGA